MRIVGTTVLAEPGVVLPDSEIEFDANGISYLGKIRGPAGVGDLDGSSSVAIPGLVNAHTHSPMTLLRGYSDDVPLHTWLTHMREFELQMTADDLLAGIRLAMVEMLRTGTIGFVDMFAWDETQLAAVADAGMRTNACFSVFGYESVAFPGADSRTGAEVLDDTPALAAAFAGHPLITVSYGLHAPYTCSPELIHDVANRAISAGIPVQIHLSETRREVDAALSEFGMSPIQHVARLGLFDTGLHVAHAVHPLHAAADGKQGDFELLSNPAVTVSHNPVSNLKLGAGIAPTPQYQQAGVNLALGTDSVASNNSLDLFEELKTGSILQRGLAEDPSVLYGGDVFRWATQGGAKALRGSASGRLAVGEPADIVLLDTAGDSGTPLNNEESFVYYTARGTDVTDVFIAGRQVVGNRRVLTLDEDAVRADVRERVLRIKRRLAS
jgi:5-methylthioadenosine/S-adenosylhomocysteine deaminase